MLVVTFSVFRALIGGDASATMTCRQRTIELTIVTKNRDHERDGMKPLA